MSSKPRLRTLALTLGVATALAGAFITSTGAASVPDTPAARAGDTYLLLPEHAGGPVGIVRRNDLLVAYAKSRHMKAHYTTLEAARDEARAKGDTTRADTIEAEGAAWQDLLHRQLAGDEPLYTILLDVEDELRAVAGEHNLSRVVEAGKGVEGLDITDELAQALTE